MRGEKGEKMKEFPPLAGWPIQISFVHEPKEEKPRHKHRVQKKNHPKKEK
jgi:hypothetical protein